MKRLTLLFVLGAMVCSAQEVRLTKATMLKSERNIVSLRAGTMVNILERDEFTLKVRFNNVTGTIPASSLAPVTTPRQTAVQPAAPAKRTGSYYVNAVNKAKDTADTLNQSSVKQVDVVLAAN